MTRGHITRRGKKSWRVKFEVGADLATGVRHTAYVTVKGTRLEAQQELTRRLAAVDAGTKHGRRVITLPASSPPAAGAAHGAGAR